MDALINLRDAQARHRGPGVPAPCVSICELDEQWGGCKGCFRTLHEIAVWSQLDDVEKTEAWSRIEARQVEPTA